MFELPRRSPFSHSLECKDSAKIVKTEQNAKEISIYFLFQLNDIAPAGGGVLTLMVLLYGVGEDVGLTFTARLSVLLGGDDDGLGAVDFVDAVDDSIKAFQLLYLLGIHIEQVLLDGTVGCDAHDDDPTSFVLYARNKDAFQYVGSGLDNGDS